MKPLVSVGQLVTLTFEGKEWPARVANVGRGGDFTIDTLNEDGTMHPDNGTNLPRWFRGLQRFFGQNAEQPFKIVL